MFDTLVKFIQNYKNSNPSGFKKWTVGIVVVVALIIVSLVLFYKSYVHTTRLVDLQHEHDVLQEQARESATNATLAHQQEEREAHSAAAQAALNQAQEIAHQMSQLEVTHQTNEELIESLHNWSDVDKHVK